MFFGFGNTVLTANRYRIEGNGRMLFLAARYFFLKKKNQHLQRKDIVLSRRVIVLPRNVLPHTHDVLVARRETTDQLLVS